MTKKEFIQNAYLLKRERFWKRLVTNHKFTEQELSKIFSQAPRKKKWGIEVKANAIRKIQFNTSSKPSGPGRP